MRLKTITVISLVLILFALVSHFVFYIQPKEFQIIRGQAEGQVHKIISGYIDGIPPIGCSSDNEQISTDAVYFSTLANVFWGVQNGAVRSSSDRITWTTTSTTPGSSPLYRGIAVIGSRIIVLDVGSPCEIHYTDDDGSSWTTVSLTGSTTCGAELMCSGTTCFIASQNSSSDLEIRRSTDSGATWSIIQTFLAATWNNDSHGIIYYDGANIVVGGNFSGTCSATTEARLVTSTNNGTSWNTYVRPTACSASGDSYTAATLFSGNFYVGGEAGYNSTWNPMILTSSDLSSWSYVSTSGLPSAGARFSRSMYGDNSAGALFSVLRNITDSELQVYFSTNGSSFSEIYSITSSALPGNLVKYGVCLFFGDSGYNYYKIFQ